MSDTLALGFSLVCGVSLGAVFFGGLWWTVRRGITAAAPAMWFCGCALLRTAIAIIGLYLVSNGDWRRLLACLLGFLLARAGVLRLSTTPHAPAKESSKVLP